MPDRTYSNKLEEEHLIKLESKANNNGTSNFLDSKSQQFPSSIR